MIDKYQKVYGLPVIIEPVLIQKDKLYGLASKVNSDEIWYKSIGSFPYLIGISEVFFNFVPDLSTLVFFELDENKKPISIILHTILNIELMKMSNTHDCNKYQYAFGDFYVMEVSSILDDKIRFDIDDF